MIYTSCLLFGFLVIILFYLAYKSSNKNIDWWIKSGVPSLKMESAIKRLWKGISILTFDEEMYKKTDKLPFAGFVQFGNQIFFVKDIELIRKICVKDFDHFVNHGLIKFEDKTFKKMLLNKEDQEWKDLRATMSPTFTTGKIRRMFPIFNDSSKKLTAYLMEEISKDNCNGTVNFEEILGRYAMDVISSAAFGIESGIFKDPDSIIAKMANNLSMKLDIWLILKSLLFAIIPFLSKIIAVRFVNREADEFFTKIIKDTIKHRENSGEKRNDFLQLMIETKHGQIDSKETEELGRYEKDAQLKNVKKIKIDDDLIAANCLLFILGGFDTVTSALIFTSYCLALNPDIQEKLRSEVDECAENSGGEMNYDDIHSLEYLDKVISETLRMYPPGIRTERKCTKEYPLNDSKTMFVPKDSIVIMPVYQIHRDEAYYPKPDVFDPERFSAENKAKRNPYTYMPFGHGPRNCIANRFALTEVKSAIANLVLNFDLQVCERTQIPIKFRSAISLKPKDGMWLKLIPRKH